MARIHFATVVTTILASALSAGCVIGTIEGSDPESRGSRRPHDGGVTSDDTSDPAPPPPEGDDAAPSPDDTAAPPPSDSGAPPPPKADSGTTPPPDTSPPPTLDYPAGPYGKTTGSVLPNLSWSGYRNGTGAWVTISLADYYDPTGSKGVRAVWLGLAAVW